MRRDAHTPSQICTNFDLASATGEKRCATPCRRASAVCRAVGIRRTAKDVRCGLDSQKPGGNARLGVHESTRIL